MSDQYCPGHNVLLVWDAAARGWVCPLCVAADDAPRRCGHREGG